METPSSTRRVTRSQTLATATTNNNIPSSTFEKCLSNSRPTRKGKQQQSQQDRSALFDITNDSPIVGLATESLETPSSAIAKKRGILTKMTPGSGEALLRGQVKTLLQKVEEEAELSKLSLESRSFMHNLKGFSNSPMGLLAPTPANTPQVLNNLSGGDGGLNLNGVKDDNNGLASAFPSPVIQESLISQVIEEKEPEEDLELLKSIITRSLLLDFSEKFESCNSSECPSGLTYQGDAESESKEKPTPDDDNASIWSVQVNASTLSDEEEEVEVKEQQEEEDYYDEAEEEDSNELLVDELCELFINRINVSEKKTLPEFEGKHTRFVYDSDDEIVEVEGDDDNAPSPGILRLNGLPTPKGKHLRFSEE